MAFDGDGVVVDANWRTANPDVYATGDCASELKFTHAADWQARCAVRNEWCGATQPSAWRTKHGARVMAHGRTAHVEHHGASWRIMAHGESWRIMGRGGARRRMTAPGGA